MLRVAVGRETGPGPGSGGELHLLGLRQQRGLVRAEDVPAGDRLVQALRVLGDVVALRAVEAGELCRGEGDGRPEETADRVGTGRRGAAERGDRHVDRWRPDS